MYTTEETFCRKDTIQMRLIVWWVWAFRISSKNILMIVLKNTRKIALEGFNDISFQNEVCKGYIGGCHSSKNHCWPRFHLVFPRWHFQMVPSLASNIYIISLIWKYLYNITYYMKIYLAMVYQFQHIIFCFNVKVWKHIFLPDIICFNI